MIGPGVAGRSRGHVGQHHVGGPNERRAQPVGRLRRHEVEMQDGDAGDRLHLLDIDGDDPARVGPARSRPDPVSRHQRPAARRRAEVHHAGARAQHVEAVVELDQLVGGARAQALALGRGDVGVVELALQPARRRHAAPARGADPLRKPAAARRPRLGRRCPCRARRRPCAPRLRPRRRQCRRVPSG